MEPRRTTAPEPIEILPPTARLLRREDRPSWKPWQDEQRAAWLRKQAPIVRAKDLMRWSNGRQTISGS